jgi:hypothetical protein
MQPCNQISSPLFNALVDVIFLQAPSKKINFHRAFSLCARPDSKAIELFVWPATKSNGDRPLDKKINKHTHTVAQFVYLPDINGALLIIFGCAPAGLKRGQKRTELVVVRQGKVHMQQPHARSLIQIERLFEFVKHVRTAWMAQFSPINFVRLSLHLKMVNTYPRQ